MESPTEYHLIPLELEYDDDQDEDEYFEKILLDPSNNCITGTVGEFQQAVVFTDPISPLRDDEDPEEKIGMYMSTRRHLIVYTPIHQHPEPNNFVEIILDNLQNLYDIPAGIFECVNLRKLSCQDNCLVTVPPLIGKLKQLEELYLNNNSLINTGLPYTLLSCVNLKVLHMQKNNTKSLPGFLLDMKSLQCVVFDEIADPIEVVRELADFQGLENIRREVFSDRRFKYSPEVARLINPFSNTTYTVENTPDSLRYMKIGGGMPSLKTLAARAVTAYDVQFLEKDYPKKLKRALVDEYSGDARCDNCKHLRHWTADFVFTHRSCVFGSPHLVFHFQSCSIECYTDIQAEQIFYHIRNEMRIKNMLEEQEEEFYMF